MHKLAPKHQAEGRGVQREAGVCGTSLVLTVQSPGQLAVENMYRQAVQQVQARWQLPWCPAALAMLHDTCRQNYPFRRSEGSLIVQNYRGLYWTYTKAWHTDCNVRQEH